MAMFPFFSLRFFFSVSVVVVVVVFAELAEVSLGQQNYTTDQYDDPGYKCSDNQTSCSTYAYYRAQTGFQNASQVGSLFGVDANSVMNYSKLTSTSALVKLGDPLIVPISCGCVYSGVSQSNVSYTIQSSDTYFGLYNNTFEFLTSVAAITNSNPDAVATQLQPSQIIVVPIRCACPSTSQLSAGSSVLLTYTIAPYETLSTIGSFFNVDYTAIGAANGISSNDIIDAYTTILIPLTGAPNVTASTLSPSPSPSGSISPPPTPAASSSSSSNNIGLYVGIGVGVCAAILILAAIAVCVALVLRRRRRQRKEDSETLSVVSKPSKIIESSGEVGSSRRTFPPGDPLAGMNDLVGSDRPMSFTFEELMEATNKFGTGSKIQGSVYRGILRGQVVAIKQMKKSLTQELKILCQVHHVNLVKLVGICASEGEHLYIVYEYAENGSLSDCLHSDLLSRGKLATKSSSYLGWTTRVQIALDAATGLEYLHDYVNPSYVHKDVKSSNILLDIAFRAKIANFGMAKSAGNNAMLTRHITGTYGYMAPEYVAHGLVTTKADVYAFGVVLLEILSGQEAILEDPVRSQERCLSSVIGPILDAVNAMEKLNAWVDPVLQNNFPLDTARGMAQLARTCLEADPEARPSMKDVTYALSHMLTSSLEWESSAVFASTLYEKSIEAR